MSRRRYVELACQLPVRWLHECVADPSTHMTLQHVLLLRVAIRRKLRSAKP